MNKHKIEELFREYEKAFDHLDIEAIFRLYADTFISAGPKGPIAQSKKEFQTMARRAGELYKSIGQNSARILSKNIMEISNEYAIVTVRWGVTFEKTGERVIEFDVSYIVMQTGDETKVILLISHEDEEEAMANLGLKPDIKKNPVN